MKKLFLAGVVLSLVFSGYASANCESISSAIDSQLKEAAYQSESGILDDSTLRETTRTGKVSVSLIQVQVLLTQLQALKCPISQTEYIYSKYTTAAGACTSALNLKRITDSEDSKMRVKESCDRSKW